MNDIREERVAEIPEIFVVAETRKALPADSNSVAAGKDNSGCVPVTANTERLTA